MGSWLEGTLPGNAQKGLKRPLPSWGEQEKQEQSLAGGTTGLRTWVHLT